MSGESTYIARDYLPSFARNRGRSLRDRQQRLVDKLLPIITVSPEQVPVKGEYRRWAFEIGFGGGEHLVALAGYAPDTLVMGCEPYINGVAKALCAIEERALKNIRIFTQDARKLVEALPETSVDEVYILFPDPWPKARHHKRRLVNHMTIAMLARVQAQGAKLLIATDHHDYATWILEHLNSTPYYHWGPKTQQDWTQPPQHWVETKYERKTSAEGRAPLFFHCIRSEKPWKAE